ncbi:MAG: RuBisCO large subunit C-terminal-like domain-containing protein [Candidatus Xenobia bacterium]
MPLSPELRPFLGPPTNLDDYVLCEYLLETGGDPLDAAAQICHESSTAMWARPGEVEDLRVRHGARLVELREIAGLEKPSWDSPFHPVKPQRRAYATIGQPLINFGSSIPNLLSAAAGEGVYHVGSLTAVKLTDFTFPGSYLSSFDGPRFGLDGIRSLLGVHGRPLFCGVVKPNLGLEPDAFARLAGDAWRGGLDVAKDDEMLADTDYCPIAGRLRAVIPELRQAEAETGEHKLYLVNLTGEITGLRERHDLVWEAAGTNGAIMLNTFTMGFSAGRMMARHTRMPLVSHFAMMAAYTRMPFFGISMLAVTRLLRLCGFDAIIMPGPGPRMMTGKTELQRCIQACIEPMGHLRPVLPVPGGSDWAGTLATTINLVGSVDFGFVPGRGVFAHPDGPGAGARSLRQAWEAYQAGQPLDTWATSHSELAAALRAFGPPG